MNRGCILPVAVKYMFDFLDDLALQNGIVDPQVVHTWKSNRYQFWYYYYYHYTVSPKKCHIWTAITLTCMQRRNFRIFVSQGSAETLVSWGGKTKHLWSLTFAVTFLPKTIQIDLCSSKLQEAKSETIIGTQCTTLLLLIQCKTVVVVLFTIQLPLISLTAGLLCILQFDI